jgi:mycothiol synthase
MTIEYRKVEYGDFDIQQVVDIALAIRPDSFESVASHIEWHDAQRAAGNLCERWLATVDGQVLGSAYIGASGVYALPAAVTSVYVAVHPEHQSRGYGRSLLERVESTARKRNRDKTYSWSDETQPRSMRFLERAGYREIDRGWESTLDLTTVDTDRVNDAVERVRSDGIDITTAAAFGTEHEDWKRQVYDLYSSVEMGIPSPFPINTVGIQDFVTRNLGSQFISEGFLVAVDGDRVVGLTETHRVDHAPRQISQRLTGVDPDYRGTGIATALKAQTAIWAMDAGYTSIRTHNAQSNAPMLAINDRLGFHCSHATIVYLKDL